MIRWIGSVAVILLMISLGGPAGAVRPADAPEAVLKRFLTAVYARDYPSAYQWISREDRKLKSKEEYVRESGAFSGAALEAARALASLIQFKDLRTTIEGDRATVTFTAVLPDANAPVIQDLLLELDEARLAALSPAERQARIERLRELARSSRLPVITGEERWELVREEGRWRVWLNWAGAVVVRFTAATKGGLPWEFVPVQPVVRARPGETLQAYYRVRNLSDQETTGKARHILDPPEEEGYLQIVSCFCFIRQRLGPGEERRLPVVFRVTQAPPPGGELRVRYEFYPLDKFPEGK